jgi:hypothetical protein
MDPPLPETLRGLDGGPIIPLTVDLHAISQQTHMWPSEQTAF